MNEGVRIHAEPSTPRRIMSSCTSVAADVERRSRSRRSTVGSSEKVADVANLLRRLCKERILEEIAKCELVCANCHAVRTVQRRDLGV
jgi:hypothetical protein